MAMLKLKDAAPVAAQTETANAVAQPVANPTPVQAAPQQPVAPTPAPAQTAAPVPQTSEPKTAKGNSKEPMTPAAHLKKILELEQNGVTIITDQEGNKTLTGMACKLALGSLRALGAKWNADNLTWTVSKDIINNPQAAYDAVTVKRQERAEKKSKPAGENGLYTEAQVRSMIKAAIANTLKHISVNANNDAFLTSMTDKAMGKAEK